MRRHDFCAISVPQRLPEVNPKTRWHFQPEYATLCKKRALDLPKTFSCVKSLDMWSCVLPKKITTVTRQELASIASINLDYPERLKF